MASYQVIARRYRPQTFAAVLGQDTAVTTIKNAIAGGKLAHAYLFCGTRGTGKTTLARLFAKALNCFSPTSEGEPCGECPSCREIGAGTSLDVIEIDGASHRGIDDIRQINETVGYTAARGQYKIYIIDEVHMLTKEAFNALLKTLEEPPAKVVFLFATTEPHKVPLTILSRCQRFNLQRIPLELIVSKLKQICETIGVAADDAALRLVARRAEGGLRDAESLLDQLIAFGGEKLQGAAVADLLGLMPREALFALDRAGHEGDYSMAFILAGQLFSQGKDFNHFIEMLIEHIRTLLMMKVCGEEHAQLYLLPEEEEAYRHAATLYRKEQCLALLDMLIEAQGQIRISATPRFFLEALLLRLLRSHQEISLETLVERLTELEARIAGENPPQPLPTPAIKKEPKPVKQESELKTGGEPPSPQPVDKLSEEASPVLVRQTQSRFETLLQFASVELEGSLQIKNIHLQPS